MFYLYSANLLLFPFITLILINNRLSSNWSDLTGFFVITYIIISTFAVKFLIYKDSNLNTMIAHVFATWAYAWALFNKFILFRNEEWQPTGGAKKGKSMGWNITITAMHIYTVFIAFVTYLGFTLLENKIFVFYLVINLFVHLIGISYYWKARFSK